jgi:molybdenum cofactor cytidylyltransferase
VGTPGDPVPVSVVVLAAGSSRRLGRPKQTLALGTTTVLGATLDQVRGAPVDQRVVTLGGASAEVRATVDLDGFDVVEVPDHGQGCSASVSAAVDIVDPSAAGLVLVLGDQPHIDPDAIAVVAAHGADQPDSPDAVITRYDDGPGHPLWLSRRCFDDLRSLQGDKAVWKLLESGTIDVHELARPGHTVPLDVDTWDDYRAVCRAAGLEPAAAEG